MIQLILKILILLRIMGNNMAVHYLLQTQALYHCYRFYFMKTKRIKREELYIYKIYNLFMYQNQFLRII